ncbi:uncharacterized protein BCR38DRAFT_186155 [Pseudomassariella vexata]|uniref:Uncharacterized protein n=1 Tax=Pseudomassariella vexata TaxID=1141098 RepID=A0A1Y2E010_9PEZI|nr:uncharacterized protein BCR38DRAFT_186155 [Pseudomassariella vexata]ORY64878.1 hypothetical protein BCR38DRAFT_186155 [Pseudomassariella vexata]
MNEKYISLNLIYYNASQLATRLSWPDTGADGSVRWGLPKRIGWKGEKSSLLFSNDQQPQRQQKSASIIYTGDLGSGGVGYSYIVIVSELNPQRKGAWRYMGIGNIGVCMLSVLYCQFVGCWIH